ncbi:MAG: class I SAM-dependent methyltransferase [Solirubrobacteraceae bacterium]
MSREAFEEVYRDGRWGFGSGHGSIPRATSDYRGFLEEFVRANKVRRIIDYGCGDWQLGRLIDWQGATYTGVDIVPHLVERNRREFSRPGVSFIVTPDDPGDLPAGDLLLCKDVLQHLPNSDIQAFLDQVTPRFPMSLVTNDTTTDPAELNLDIPAGNWRPVDIREAPFGADAVVIKSLVMPRVRARSWRLRGQFNASTKPIMLLRGAGTAAG